MSEDCAQRSSARPRRRSDLVALNFDASRPPVDRAADPHPLSLQRLVVDERRRDRVLHEVPDLAVGGLERAVPLACHHDVGSVEPLELALAADDVAYHLHGARAVDVEGESLEERGEEAARDRVGGGTDTDHHDGHGRRCRERDATPAVGGAKAALYSPLQPWGRLVPRKRCPHAPHPSVRRSARRHSGHSHTRTRAIA